MRLTPIALSVAIALATMASAGHGQKPDDQIASRSLELTEQARTLQASARYSEAIDLLESALAVDPRNRQAYVGLARVAQSQKLPGKAIRFYSEALKLEPNDVNALTGQGEAYVQRGAVDRARQNLARVRTLCGSSCAQADTLAASIQRGPPADLAAQRAPVPAPTPTTTPPTPNQN